MNPKSKSYVLQAELDLEDLKEYMDYFIDWPIGKQGRLSFDHWKDKDTQYIYHRNPIFV